MSSVFGDKIKISLFGESHGEVIGVVIDGLESGLKLDIAGINHDLARRSSKNNGISTKRIEEDKFEIVSGLFNEKTTGAPLCATLKNNDVISTDYLKIKDLLRPSHADYTAFIKYNGYNDYRGGGHFSGRLTAPLVFAGAICKQILIEKDIEIFGRVKSIGNIKDKEISYTDIPKKKEYLDAYKRNVPALDNEKSKMMENLILKAKEDKNSVGGSIEVVCTGVKAGFGNPFFDSVESVISHLAFSIPAVKGIEFGAGFDFADMTGFEANDEYYIEDDIIKTKTNHNGGILGGISNGMPIVFTAFIKPTPSISKTQNTVNIKSRKNETITIEGRHDPCIVPRAVVVMEAVAAISLVQFL